MNDSEVARELLQYRVIAAAFRRSMEHELVVKGGFALRLGMNSRRATKDIDLQQSTKFPLPHLQTLMRHAISEALDGSGLTGIVVSAPKQTETTARWKINGTTAGGSAVHLTIEVSRRDNMPGSEHLKRVPIAPAKSGGMAIGYAEVFNENAMAASKTIAILSEQRVVARDLFDLDLLIRMQAVPPPDMIEHLARPEMVMRLHQKLELITWDMFKDQVLTTIAEDKYKDWDEDRFLEAKITVASAVETWLTKHPARSQAPAFAP